jgi:hypothetical protein
MTRKYRLNDLHLKYKGVFDFEQLYRYIYKWMHDRKYRTQEDKYKNKPTSPWGFEHELRIFGSKKVDEFYKYWIGVWVHVIDGEEKQIDGETVMEGRVKITIRSSVTTDYAGRFEKNWFTKWLENIYTNHIIDREIELTHLDAMHYRLHEFQQELKDILNVYSDENYYQGA